MTPTRCRIVELIDPANAEPLPAIVVRAHEDGCLTVVAFSDDYPLTCAKLYRHVGRSTEPGRLGWKWPDRQ